MAKIVVYDNEGKSFDRYTVLYDDSVFTMSKNATSPQGVNLYCGGRDEYPKDLTHLGKIVELDSLPEEVKKAIDERCNTPDQ